MIFCKLCTKKVEENCMIATAIIITLCFKVVVEWEASIFYEVMVLQKLLPPFVKMRFVVTIFFIVGVIRWDTYIAVNYVFCIRPLETLAIVIVNSKFVYFWVFNESHCNPMFTGWVFMALVQHPTIDFLRGCLTYGVDDVVDIKIFLLVFKLIPAGHTHVFVKGYILF